MGLAASQARLLSITARMSDTELRSQLISNAKMRLTTDSARVSDEYITALNQTQLMFQNFDPEGNEMYQALTFASLTAYSAYNNQYGIVNNSGEIIVSATEAANFKTANGNLDKFLEQYGLKQTTDYFETMNTSQEYLSIFENRFMSGQKGVGYYDEGGYWQNFEVTPEELQAMWEKEVDSKGVHHYGQLESLNSLEYGDYENLVATYNSKKDTYKTTLNEQMKEYLKGNDVFGGQAGIPPFIVTGYSTLDGCKTYDDYYECVLSYCDGNTNYSFDELVNAFRDFARLYGISDLEGKGKSLPGVMADLYNGDLGINDPLLDILSENIKLATMVANNSITQHFYDYDKASYYLELDADGNIVGDWGSPTTTGKLTAPGTGSTVYEGYSMDPADYVSGVPGTGEIAVTFLPGEPPPTATVDGHRFVAAWTDGNGNYSCPGATNWDSAVYTNQIKSDVIWDETVQITDEDKKTALRYLWETLRNSALKNMSSTPFTGNNSGSVKGCPKVETAWNEYKEAAAQLAKFIYGDTAGPAIVEEMANNWRDLDMIDYLDDPSWVLSQNTTNPKITTMIDSDGDGEADTPVEEYGKISTTHFNPFYKDYPTTTLTSDEAPISDLGVSGAEYHVNYQVVKDLFLLECMLEHYGEPTYTWIDETNKNEDGQAKATWYSNLFNRMQQGYTTLGEGLSNNQEWLQFAFESGLVHMEQVNKSSEWVSTSYSNCSAITESTIDVDITLAEAKYNREMAKIQAKDRQYDIELKNIDTEHESLKQEYESIKKVISKNIDRNYKMFQNA